jgi:hypothetical protein
MNEEQLNKLKEDLVNAMDQGKDVDYGYDGVDEIAVDVFYTHIALEHVLETLRKHGLLPAVGVQRDMDVLTGIRGDNGFTNRD